MKYPQTLDLILFNEMQYCKGLCPLKVYDSQAKKLEINPTL